MSQKLQDDLHMFGLRIKQHEDNIKLLNTEKNNLEDSILDMRGFHIVSRVALNIGVSKVVYPVYRNIIALLLLGPFAYFLEKVEKLNIARRDGLAKVLGTVASVGGATIITLYKGPPLLLHQELQSLQGYVSSEEDMFSSYKTQNWTWGCIYLIGHCLSWAGWMVLQIVTDAGHSANELGIAAELVAANEKLKSHSRKTGPLSD